MSSKLDKLFFYLSILVFILLFLGALALEKNRSLGAILMISSMILAIIVGIYLDYSNIKKLRDDEPPAE